MHSLLWIIVLSPFLGSLILAFFGAAMPRKLAGAIGCASVGASWAATMAAAGIFLGNGASVAGDSMVYPWISIGSLQVAMGLHLDALSLVIALTITFVAFIIHLYSYQSMREVENYSRFFAEMNLFVGSMLILVLAGNLLLLYLGWEGVGLCSYLLIGFHYKETTNGHAAQKAFIVTRIGDTAMIIALFLAFKLYGTLDIQKILAATPGLMPVAGTLIAAIALLLLGGAVGKSAQIPFQTWLPDAMAGPTPVSALIHAATMVIAGVYLIARMNALFTVSPAAHLAVAVIGAVTLLYAGISALVQRDIKRVLAYSTISQIGYMFLALGMGAWTAAIFHLVTHAFFKSLLFLSAGVVIDALHHEQDMFKMGGLKRQLPVAYWTFLVGAASLSALPFVTAGFYSKDAIVWASRSSTWGSAWFWLAATAGSLITAAYAFRAVFLTFHGEQRQTVSKQPGPMMNLSLVTLSVFAVVAGFISMPGILGGFDPFGRLMESVLPSMSHSADYSLPSAEIPILIVSVAASLAGLYLAYVYFRRRRWSEAVERSDAGRMAHRFFASGWGFDWLYDRLFVQPFKIIAYGNRSDVVDMLFEGMGTAARYANTLLSRLQTGRMRDYAVGLLLGAILVAAIALAR